ncbi:MAG: hypothetical protein ACRENG_21005, partial [bacterium]
MKLKIHSRFVSCLLLLFLMFSGSVFAQSIYSRHGIGLLRYRHTVRSIGMGGIGLAITDTVYAHFLNPAVMGRLNLTRIQGDFLYERASIDLPGTDGLFHEANINSLSLAFPVKRGYAFTFGV